MSKRLRCSACRDVLGAYEPVVAVKRDGRARGTSLLAADDESGAILEEATLYHANCFTGPAALWEGHGNVERHHLNDCGT